MVFKEWQAHQVGNLLSNGSGSVFLTFCLKIFQKVPFPFYLLYDLKSDYSNDEDGDVEDGYFNIKSFTKLFLETTEIVILYNILSAYFN